MQAGGVRMERWTAKKKAEIVLDIIKGDLIILDFCRENDLKQSEVETWMDTFIKEGTSGLKANSKLRKQAHKKEIDELKKVVGELSLENFVLKKNIELEEEEERES